MITFSDPWYLLYDLHVCDILHLCLGLQNWKSHYTALRIHARDPHARARAELRTSGPGPPEREQNQNQNPTEPPARHAEAPRQQAHPRVLTSRFKTPGNRRVERRQRKTHAPASGASERETRRTDRETQSTLSRASIYSKCSYSSLPLSSVCVALPRMMLALCRRRALEKRECWSEGARALDDAHLRGGDEERRGGEQIIKALYWLLTTCDILTHRSRLETLKAYG